MCVGFFIFGALEISSPVFADQLLMSFSKDCYFSEDKIAMVEDVEWPADYSQ